MREIVSLSHVLVLTVSIYFSEISTESFQRSSNFSKANFTSLLSFQLNVKLKILMEACIRKIA